MIKVIPEQKVYICDICLKEHVRPNHDPKLTYHMDALDYAGQPVGDASSKYDLCNSCHTEFTKMFKQFISSKRE